MPAAAIPVISAVSDLVKALYDGSEKKTLVEQDEITFSTESTIKTSKIGFTDRNGASFNVPILVTIESNQARLAPIKDGKFDPATLSENVVNSEFLVGDGKSVPILELITTSDNATTKLARPLIESLMSGKDYGKDPTNKKEDDVNFRCGALYDSLHLYLSKFDARAMFWSFVRRYGDRIDSKACVGSRGTELEAVGLKL
jgi:hypothetical protein